MAYNQINFTSEPFIKRSFRTQATSTYNTLLGEDSETIKRNRRIYGISANSTMTNNVQIWVSGSFSGSDPIPLFKTSIPAYSGFKDLGDDIISSYDIFACNEGRKIFQQKQDSEGNYYFDLPGDCSLTFNTVSTLTTGIISILTFGEV